MRVDFDPIIDRGKSISLPVDEHHTIVIRRRTMHRVEAEDLHFHVNSAVFLGEHSDLTKGGQGLTINGLDVLRRIYSYARDHTDQKLVIVGHTDATGTPDDNLELSRLRAQGIYHLLLGNREGWVEVAQARSRVEDYQQILCWLAAALGWPCATTDGITGEHDEDTESAVLGFQQCYNEDLGQDIEVDGQMGPQTWGAIFDVYRWELATMLETDEGGLREHEDALKFLDPEILACGQWLPRSLLGGSGYRGSSDRRVEALFCEPSEEPPKKALADGRDCLLKHPAIRFEPLEVEAGPKRIWFTLHAADELGARLPNFTLTFGNDKGVFQTTTTDENGVWKGRALVELPIEVRQEDGSPVYLGSQAAGDGKTPTTLTPQAGACPIVDLIVPGQVDPEVLAHRDELLSLYDAGIERGAYTARSGAPQQDRGEPMKKVSGRGHPEPILTNRGIRSYVLDNLFIAAGFTEDRVDKLHDLVHEWLQDRMSAVTDRGYMLSIFDGPRVHFFDEAGKLETLPLADGVVIQGQVGLYGTLAMLGGIWEPYQSLADGGRTGFEAARESAAGHDSGADKASDSKDASKRAERGMILSDIVDSRGGADARARDLVLQNLRSFKLAYVLPPVGRAMPLAAAGGSGVLEPYPSDSAVGKRVHQRNLQVVKNCNRAYVGDIFTYIDEVKAIDAQIGARSSEELEEELHRLGEPPSAPTFERPPGASSTEYSELVEAGRRELDAPGRADAYDAHQARTETLNRIWGVRSAGSAWVDCEFAADAAASSASGETGLSATLKWNFEADTDGNVKTGNQQSLKLNTPVFDIAAERKGGGEEASYSGKLSKDIQAREFDGYVVRGRWERQTDAETGYVTTLLKVEFDLRLLELHFEFEFPSGKVKATVSALVVDMAVQWNPETGQLRYAVGGDMREGLKRLTRELGKSPPAWMDELPSLQAKVSGGFQLSPERGGAVLAMVLRSPGFTEKRPRGELMEISWATLRADEQAALSVLGFTQETWNRREHVAATQRPFSQLAPDQRVATYALPVPNADPYWQSFWKKQLESTSERPASAPDV